ncbi:MAG: RNA-binding S4 domain-containing protein [Stenomitos rutilans HA7619-LM2]|jgi:ribosome-associated protein|nr:RNA-binding S4 domain-containing protein [Stenomitos rutilans HA7619-LM2]
MTTEVIKLDQFLKAVGIVSTGGQAKLLIQSGEVKVNGTVETRRGRKLVLGDRVSTMGETLNVEPSTLQAHNTNEPNPWA